eukprot:6331619-Heterocapsa_arctica.AAC.1
MQRYRRKNHDIIFDGWWACQSCLAKGPALNKRNCINPTHKHDADDENDDRHRHKKEEDRSRTGERTYRGQKGWSRP